MYIFTKNKWKCHDFVWQYQYRKMKLQKPSCTSDSLYQEKYFKHKMHLLGNVRPMHIKINNWVHNHNSYLLPYTSPWGNPTVSSILCLQRAHLCRTAFCLLYLGKKNAVIFFPSYTTLSKLKPSPWYPQHHQWKGKKIKSANWNFLKAVLTVTQVGVNTHPDT